MQSRHMDTKPISVADVYAGADNAGVRKLGLCEVTGNCLQSLLLFLRNAKVTIECAFYSTNRLWCSKGS
jgi:hypothetical protein